MTLSLTRYSNTFDIGASSLQERTVEGFDQVELGLQQSVGEQYAVRSSMGCGAWASVPWLAVSHPSESTQHGLYLQVRVRVP